MPATPQTDIFQLGMMSWLTASGRESKPHDMEIKALSSRTSTAMYPSTSIKLPPSVAKSRRQKGRQHGNCLACSPRLLPLQMTEAKWRLWHRP
jgi:hypothetical protein